jgi:hypothetical protein
MTNANALVPGAGLEPARTLPGPRDFKSRVSTNSTIRAQLGIGNRGLGIRESLLPQEAMNQAVNSPSKRFDFLLKHV